MMFVGCESMEKRSWEALGKPRAAAALHCLFATLGFATITPIDFRGLIYKDLAVSNEVHSSEQRQERLRREYGLSWLTMVRFL
jgi:hypothetical protein